MKFVTAIWLDNLQSFEENVGLSYHVHRGTFSAECPLYACVLRGIESITSEYCQFLSSGGIELIDCQSYVVELSAIYREKLQFVDNYEYCCFIRWLVFSKVFSSEKIIHIDSDIYINIPAIEASLIFEELTGTFGSPCFAAVSQADWYESYRYCLDSFLHDRTAFQEKYLDKSRLILRSFIGSDQDFISILDSHSLLRNDLSNHPIHKRYNIFVNPLWPYISKPENPQIFSNLNGIDYINGLPVLFWHFQNDFAIYLARFYFLFDMLNLDVPIGHELLNQTQVPNPYSRLFPSSASHAFYAIDRYFINNKHQHTLSFSNAEYLKPRDQSSPYNPYIRKYLYHRFLANDTKKFIFSSKYWWEDNIWQ